MNAANAESLHAGPSRRRMPAVSGDPGGSFHRPFHRPFRRPFHRLALGACLGVSCREMLRAWILTLALIAAAAPQSARATRLVPLTIEQLAQASDLIVHGIVREMAVQRDERGRIFTTFQLSLEDVWKGDVPDGMCRIVEGGGVLGESALTARPHPGYAVGQEVVAFLVRNPAGEWVTLGMAQGRFEVRREPSSTRRYVANPFWGQTVTQATPVPWKRPLPLEELRRRVREVRP